MHIIGIYDAKIPSLALRICVRYVSVFDILRYFIDIY